LQLNIHAVIANSIVGTINTLKVNSVFLNSYFNRLENEKAKMLELE